ncbi:MAG: hypothetical protein ACTHKS_15465 [Gaiellaceae bacterium]
MTGKRTVLAAVAVSAVTFVLFGGIARAAAPTATTGPATAIGATTATVTGGVVPGGQATTWYIQYGTTTAYGSQTAKANAGSGTVSVNITSNLASLKPGSTYHYRVVASNTAGTAHGSDAVFTTLTPPGATTGAATAIGSTSATLNGTVDPNSRDTTFYFEYGTTTSYGTKTASKSAGSGSSPQNETAGISGLQVGKTYHFRIVATSDAGTTTGSDATFTTSSAPVAVTADATAVSVTTATLRGQVTPNGLSTTWWFEYGTSTAYGLKTASHSAGSSTSAKSVSDGVTKLAAGKSYHFRLVAQNSSGRVYGLDRVFTTIGAPTTTTGAAQSVGADTAQLTGTLDTLGRATTWWFEYGTTTKYGKSTTHRSAATKAGAQTVTAPLTGLAANTAYHYRLVAKSDAGTRYGADATFTTSGVSLVIASRQVVFGGRIKLTGTVPTHTAGEQVIVFSKAYGSGSFRSIATVLTGTDGAWTYLVRPRIATSYQASWRNGLSAAVSVGVHPRVGLTRFRDGHFFVTVAGNHAFAHKVVQLQRKVGTRWVTIKRVRLGLRSRVEFRATIPTGRSTVRAAFSVNQAGAGYLGGTSRALTFTRT